VDSSRERETMSGDQQPGRGFFGWLGRQVGHVRKALKSDSGAKCVYRNESVQEEAHPLDPNVKLRRTTVDEAIVEKKHQ
jgi:hypothetical protein